MHDSNMAILTLQYFMVMGVTIPGGVFITVNHEHVICQFSGSNIAIYM